MTAYRQTMTKALQEMYLSEDNVDLMRKAADGAMQTIKMKDGKLKMDMFTASAIMQVFDKVNPANQKKMTVMINKGTKAGMLKLQSFAMKQVKSEYGEEVDLDEVRQLKNPKKEVLVVKGGKVIVINKKDAKEYLNKGWELAEEVDLDEKADLKKIDTGQLEKQLGLLKIGKPTPRMKDTAKRIRDELKSRGIKAEELDLDEASKLPPHLAKFFDKDGDLKKDVADRIAKGKEKLNIKDVTPKGYGPNEEAELDEGKMSQLHQYIKDKKSAEEIAKLMKVDVKTIKTLMSSNNPEDVEESAASDARRAMSRDKDLGRGKDSADDDDDATDDDVKGASKNIMMQLRKAQSLKGRFDVEFADGKKTKVSANIAMAVQQKYNAQKRPAEKEKFQAKIGKSYKNMLSALKEELQPKKESVLERMNRKIKENKDG